MVVAAVQLVFEALQQVDSNPRFIYLSLNDYSTAGSKTLRRRLKCDIAKVA
jgi:hypothetical protein